MHQDPYGTTIRKTLDILWTYTKHTLRFLLFRVIPHSDYYLTSDYRLEDFQAFTNLQSLAVDSPVPSDKDSTSHLLSQKLPSTLEKLTLYHHARNQLNGYKPILEDICDSKVMGYLPNFKVFEMISVLYQLAVDAPDEYIESLKGRGITLAVVNRP